VFDDGPRAIYDVSYPVSAGIRPSWLRLPPCGFGYAQKVGSNESSHKTLEPSPWVSREKTSAVYCLLGHLYLREVRTPMYSDFICTLLVQPLAVSPLPCSLRLIVPSQFLCPVVPPTTTN
jgi:hypothetical protein